MEEILFREVLTDESLVKAHASISLKNNLYYQEVEAISWYTAEKRILKRLRGCSRDTFLLSDIVDMTRDALSPTRAWFAARELREDGTTTIDRSEWSAFQVIEVLNGKHFPLIAEADWAVIHRAQDMVRAMLAAAHEVEEAAA